MITLEQILCRCTDEQLESLMSSAQAIMQHFEYVSGWKVYGINAMAFTELAQRAQGKHKRVLGPIG